MLESLIDYVVLISCIGFLLFLIPGKHQKYTAIVGWTAMEVILFLMFPKFIAEGSFIYILIAFAALPCVYITAKNLLKDEYFVKRLTYAASIAYLIYAPFAFIPVLGNWLIGIVTTLTASVLTFIGTEFVMYDWNMFMGGFVPGSELGYRVEIVLGCTGIQAIAIMVGVVAMIPMSWKRKIAMFFLVSIPIFVVNIFRNTYVVTAYTEQWYPWFQEWFTGPEFYGYASFFWAHNVFCEVLAIAVLIGLAYALFKLNPEMVKTIQSIGIVYYEGFIEIWNRLRGVKSNP